MVFIIVAISSCHLKIEPASINSATANSEFTNVELPKIDSNITVDSVLKIFQNIPINLHPDSIIKWSKKNSFIEPSIWIKNNASITTHVFKIVNPIDYGLKSDSINFLIDEINWVEKPYEELENSWKGYRFTMVYHFNSEEDARIELTRLSSEIQKLTNCINDKRKRMGGDGIGEFYRWGIIDPYFLESNLHPEDEFFELELLNSYTTPWQIRIQLELAE